MSEDLSGLWYIDGKVCSADEMHAVWATFETRRKRFYDKREKMEKRHRKEALVMEAERQRMMLDEPFTPWVGHVADGPNAGYMKSARRDNDARKARKKKDADAE